MANAPFASDLSYQVLQQRRRRQELSCPPLDKSMSSLHPAIERLGVCQITGARLDVLAECVTGERVPLECECSDALRGVRHHEN